MLSRNQKESELSLAYLHAIAAKVGYSVTIPHIDSDSVDAIIAAKGKVAVDSIRHSPRIEVQLKASVNCSVDGQGNIPHQLPRKNYDDLRIPTVLPRLLVLLALPHDEADWLVHQADKLILQKCAYFLNLEGAPENSGVDRPTVHVPMINMLTPGILVDLMIRASKLERL